jgi:hypothetical protein
MSSYSQSPSSYRKFYMHKKVHADPLIIHQELSQKRQTGFLASSLCDTFDNLQKRQIEVVPKKYNLQFGR